MINREMPDALTRAELAKAILKSLVDKESKRKWREYRREKARTRMLNRECKESKSALRDLFQVCLQNFSPVTSPLALISQIQRSGGTLLAQLGFDRIQHAGPPGHRRARTLGNHAGANRTG